MYETAEVCAKLFSWVIAVVNHTDYAKFVNDSFKSKGEEFFVKAKLKAPVFKAPPARQSQASGLDNSDSSSG